MQQPKRTAGNHKQVDTMLKFSIFGNGLETAGWINVAFSRTQNSFQDGISNTHCVLRIGEHDVHSNHLQKRERKKIWSKWFFYVSCNGGCQLISVQDKVPHKKKDSWASGEKLILSYLDNIKQKLLIWEDVVDKEGSLHFLSLKPLWQKVTQLFVREIERYT